MLPDLHDESEVGNPKKNDHLDQNPAEMARNILLLGFAKQESVPSATTQNTAKQHLLPFPQVERSCLVPSQSKRGLSHPSSVEFQATPSSPADSKSK